MPLPENFLEFDGFLNTDANATNTQVNANTTAIGTKVTSGGALGTPSSGTLTNTTGLPVASVVGDTSTALGVGSINLGHATDTTITRTGAGAIAVEGLAVTLNSTSLVHTASTIELGHATDTTLSRSAAGKLAVEGIDVVLVSGAQSLASKTLTNPTVTSYTESVVVIGSSSTAKTIDLTNGTVQTCTLTGNCTFTMPTATAGKSFVLLLSTGAGSFTATFTSVKWPAGTAPTITTTASRLDIVTFVADGTNWYGSIAQNYTP